MAAPLCSSTGFGASDQNVKTQTASSATRRADRRTDVVWTDAGGNWATKTVQSLSPDSRSIRAERTTNAGSMRLKGAPRVVGVAAGYTIIVGADFASNANGDIQLHPIAAINTRGSQLPSFH